MFLGYKYVHIPLIVSNDLIYEAGL
jgi:hypothetical protein